MSPLEREVMTRAHKLVVDRGEQLHSGYTLFLTYIEDQFSISRRIALPMTGSIGNGAPSDPIAVPDDPAEDETVIKMGSHRYQVAAFRFRKTDGWLKVMEYGVSPAYSQELLQLLRARLLLDDIAAT